jgi:SAM-dependent methyltransferase
MNTLQIVRRLIPRPARSPLRRLSARALCRFTLTPTELAAMSDEVAYSAAGHRWNTKISRGIGGWVDVPNHSQGYHGLLQQWWMTYGLGRSALLVSESCEVGAVFQNLYPEVRITTTDYFLNLTSQRNQTDIVWNLYDPIPPGLTGAQFGSVICQATLEHILDPVGVLRKLVELLADGGHLYLHTHTPLFPYHPWPRDYLRFFPDWFRDLSLVIPEIHAIEVYYAKGHAFATYHKRRAAIP